ncbi:MAG: DUF3108 domain-containing protein [Pseudomonadota bacterium]
MRVAIFSAVIAAASVPAVAQDNPLTRAFSVHAGGVKVAEGDIAVTRFNQAYAVAVSVEDAGIASFFVDALYTAQVEGVVEADGTLRPDLFSVKAWWDGDEQELDINYDGQGPVLVDYRPEPDWLEGPLPAVEDQGGTVDPLTVFAHMLWPASPEELCGRGFEVFSGSRRSSILPEAPLEPRDGVITCPVEYTRFEANDEGIMEPETMDFRIELRAREDGLWEADRLVGDTRFGSFVMKSRDG